MVLVVTTLLPESPADLPGAQRLGADLLEVRLDGLGTDQVTEAVQAVPAPLLASCRRKEDGGLQTLPEDEREARLEAAIRSGVAMVDLEADAAFRDRLCELALTEGTRVVISHHDLEATPTVGEGLDLLEGMCRKADVVKLATKVDGPEDLQRLFELSLRAPTLGVPFAVMGVGDSALRAAAGPLGMALVYTAPGRVGVPGQLATPLQLALPRAPPPPEGFRDYVLLGHPVSHSLSPRMQNAAFAHLDVGARYRLVDVAPGDLEAALRGLKAMGVAGGNVTAPHKGALFRLCDHTSPVASEAAAVNSFTFDGDLVHGHNTDGLGVVAALRARGEDPKGREVVLVGAGGTARATAHALAKAGAHLTITNRTGEKARVLADQVGAEVLPLEAQALDKALPEDAILFNATPVDPPVGEDALARSVVFDATYGPGKASLARRAKLVGTRALDGLDLLVAQGDLAIRYWLDIAADEALLGVMSCAARTGALEQHFQRGSG